MTFEPVPEETPSSRILKIVAIAGAIVLAGVLVVGGGSYLGRTVGDALGAEEGGDGPANVEPGQPVTIEIPEGSTGQDIGAILAANGVVRSALEFEVAVRNVNAAQQLQAGTYDLTTLMDPADVVAELVTGPGAVTYRLTAIEGLRVSELLTQLAEGTGHEYDEFETALLDGSVTTALREMPAQPTLQDWEGLLFPDTYEFAQSATPVEILQRMASTMEQRVESIDWSAWEEQGYTPYQGIILASLIESEVLVDEERPIVSSVIHNRLAEQMPLDIDATVLYALGTRDVAEFDREVDSPYNTYRNPGLPPTPIASPRLSSLEAAAAPASTPYFFYVLSDTEGRHAFAETLDEHNANVAQAREDGVLP
ncbi:MAG TPA: endolytic transglycosylase MltG [Acidimicrobiia bacterium]|nr:endolytic transglycosylase MltG [Acidimicrobiia bacterium]